MRKRLIGAGLEGRAHGIGHRFGRWDGLRAAGWAQHSQPNLSPDDQLAPSQMTQPMPGAVAEPGAPPSPAKPAPKPAPKPPATHASATPAPDRPKSPRSKARRPRVRTVVECSGPFAKDSGMLALAMAYDSRNMIFTHETVPGGEADVTVLFPNDPRRRLEVWWSNPNRTGTYLIDIAGKSIWTGPQRPAAWAHPGAAGKAQPQAVQSERLRSKTTSRP